MSQLAAVFKRLRGDAYVHKEMRRLGDQVQALEAAMRALREEEPRPGPRTRRSTPARRGKRAGRGKRPGAFDVAPAHIHKLFEDPRPWMVEAAVEHATSLVTAEMVGLEWGGGASTPFWCERLGRLHTVEASPGWAAILLDYMTKRPDLADRWRLHFVGANWASVDTNKRRTGRPLPPAPVKEALEADYAALLPQRMDIIFVDGAARQTTTRCLGDFLERDRPRVVVVDNTESDYVSEPLDALSWDGYERTDHWQHDPDKVPAHLDGWCTTVFTRR